MVPFFCRNRDSSSLSHHGDVPDTTREEIKLEVMKMSDTSDDMLSRRRTLARIAGLAIGAYMAPALTTLSVAQAGSSGGSGGGDGGGDSDGGSSGSSSSSDTSSPSSSEDDTDDNDDDDDPTPSTCSGPDDDDEGCGDAPAP
jgi:hypothetical protein